MQDQCTREDLLAVVPRYGRWSVAGNGDLGDFWSDGDIEADTSSIEEYWCANCGEYFTSKKRYGLATLNAAWALAVAHLPGQ